MKEWKRGGKHGMRTTKAKSMSMDTDLWLLLKERSAQENRSQARILSEAVRRYLEER